MYKSAQNSLAKANATVCRLHAEEQIEDTQMKVYNMSSPHDLPTNEDTKQDFV